MAENTGRKSSQANSLEDLFNLLSSNDAAMSQQAKSIIIDGLINSARAGETSSWLQNYLIDYYLRTGCDNAAEILTKIQDSQARFLFDKINIALANVNTCLQAIQLLGNIARSQPSWLYRIGNNAALPTLLKCLKNQQDAEILICGIFTLTVLLPSMPTLAKPYLPEMFEIFIRLTSWRIKKPGHVPDLFLQHLLVGANIFFQRLYGMFPCTCISLLKSFCKSKANRDIFEKTVQPLLGQLRFHPLLVTSDCNEETHQDRWKKLEPYEIVVESSKVVSGISDIYYDENAKESMLSSRRCPHTYQVVSDDVSALPDKSTGESFSTTMSIDIHQVPKLGSSNNTSAITSTTDVESNKRSISEKVYPSNEQPAVATNKIDKVPLVAFQDSHELWSPSLLLDVDSPPTTPELNRHHSSRISTPGLSSEMHNRPIDSPFHTTATDPINEPNCTNPITKTTQQTDIDKENSSTTTKNNESLIQENFGNVKYSTPKQTSHDSQDNQLPSNDTISESLKQTSKDHIVIHRKISEGKPRKKTTSPVPFKKEPEFAMDMEAQITSDHDVVPCRMYSLTSMDLFTMNNVHQGDASAIPDVHTWPPNPYVLNDSKLQENPSENIFIESEQNSPTEKEAQSNNSQIHTNNTAITKVDNVTDNSATPKEAPVNTDMLSTNADALSQENSALNSYATLMDAALRPLTNTLSNQQKVNNSPIMNNSYYNFSPKLPSDCHSMVYPSFTSFEDYLTLASDIHSEELKRIPLVDCFETNWNYFGGSAPADEVIIFKGQSRLLLNQLLFERYQTEMYSQRNRQLVRRTYRLNALEEECLAMKDQLRYQEAEIHHLKLYLKLQEEEQRRIKSEREKWELDIKTRVRSLNNEKLQSQRKIDQLSDKISVVLSQSDHMKQELSTTKADLFKATTKLKQMDQLEIKNKALLEMNDRLKNELILLSEYCSQQLDSNTSSMRSSLLRAKQQIASFAMELSVRNETIEKQKLLTESMKCQVADLENRIKSKELALKSEKDMLKESKDIHASEIEVIERKYQSLQKICRKYESYILKLHSQLELTQKDNRLNISTDSDTQLSADSLQTAVNDDTNES